MPQESDSADDDAESSKTAKSSKLSTGAWKPQPHFVWDLILDRLLPTPGAGTNVNTNVKSSSGSSKNLKIGSIQEFWRVVVDESLFSVTSSPERKYWGFQLFNRALSRATQAAYPTQSAEAGATATTTTSVVPYLFTPNFMRTFINHLSAPDRTLHTLARSTASQIQSAVKTAPELGLALLAQLTGTNGSRQFDRLTKTKTIEGILAAMDARGIEAYVRHLLEQVTKATADEYVWAFACGM
jgi:DNA polymerase phi